MKLKKRVIHTPGYGAEVVVKVDGTSSLHLEAEGWYEVNDLRLLAKKLNKLADALEASLG